MWELDIKKAEHWRIDTCELWCWRRVLRGRTRLRWLGKLLSSLRGCVVNAMTSVRNGLSVPRACIRVRVSHSHWRGWTGKSKSLWELHPESQRAWRLTSQLSLCMFLISPAWPLASLCFTPTPVCLSPGSHVAVPGGPCGPMLTPALVPGEAVGEGVCGGQRYHPHFFCVSLFLLRQKWKCPFLERYSVLF